VWQALTAETAAWWGAPYQRGEAVDIVLDARLGGHLEERWGDDEGAVWGTVTAIRRDEHLEIEGPIGMTGPVARDGTHRPRSPGRRDGGATVARGGRPRR
jgi:hypothetical protein